MHKKIPHDFILQINAEISFGKLKHLDGSTVEFPLANGRISKDGKVISPQNISGDSFDIPTNQLQLKITPNMLESWEDTW